MIRERINKIDYQLKQLFETVNISEKNKKSDFYFQIDATSKVNINGKDCLATIRAMISKPELNEKNIKWRYFVDTNDDKSDCIEIQSSVDSLASDIFETLQKKRMSSKYLNSLDPISDPIFESYNVQTDQKVDDEKLTSILNRFDVKNKILEETIFDDNVEVKNWIYEKKLSDSNKYMLFLNLTTAGYRVNLKDDQIWIQSI